MSISYAVYLRMVEDAAESVATIQALRTRVAELETAAVIRREKERARYTPVVMGWAESVVVDAPQLKRGRVWCRRCGKSNLVNSSFALRHGWPKCCGYTMTIDSPDERAALAKEGE